jgi:hypothetical protein
MADQLCGYWFLHSVDPVGANNVSLKKCLLSALFFFQFKGSSGN